MKERFRSRTGQIRVESAAPVLLSLLIACPPAEESAPVELRGDAPGVDASAPVLKRLTQAQYENSLRDLFGEDLILTVSLEPDAAADGLLQIGASTNALSAWGVEHYESSAFDVAEQVIASDAMWSAWVACTPAGPVDETCARESLAALGAFAWRRPLDSAELDRIVAAVSLAGTTLGDFRAGMAYGIAALIQSPHFLYRVEIGEDDGAGGRRYTGWEMASRLSYFLWNTTPDTELLLAAEAGDLVTPAGVAAQVDRLLADDRAREGVRTFFTDMLVLYALDDLNKDPTVYVHMSDSVGPSAREETLLGLDWLIFEEDGDWRDTFTTRTAFLDRKLAAIYNVAAPAREGFAQTELPDNHERRGFLGQASFLALNAHPSTTSVTRRGLFVREVLLCQDLPAPPAGVNTSIPEASGDAPTMRDRVAVHLTDPNCASCHQVTDPIGLGLENFDGLAGWRTTENETQIDASGDLDGVAFSDGWDLGGVVREHAALGPCFARTLFEYAGAHVLDVGEVEILDWHSQGFAESGYRVKFLLQDIATSPAFAAAGEVE